MNGMEEITAEGNKPLSEQKYRTARKRKKEPAKLLEISKDRELSVETKIDKKRILFTLNLSFKIGIDRIVVAVIASRNKRARESNKKRIIEVII